jgi:hypothetical protein
MENFGELHQICLKVFSAVSKTTSVFILPLFVGRIVFANVLGEGSKAFATVKGVVIYFCLVTGFPMIMDILFSIPEAYLPKVQSMNDFWGASPDGFELGVIPFALDRILEVVLAGLYWIVYYLHVFFMLVMCSMAPIVFLASTLLGVGLGLEIFMGLLIAGSSWPIIWYGFDQVHSSLASAQTDAFGAKCLELLLTLFKGLSPVAFAAVAIKSPAGKVVTGVAQAGISGGKWAFGRVAPSPKFSGNSSKSLESRFQKQTNDQGHRRGFGTNGGGPVFDKDFSPDRLKQAKKQNPKVKKERESNEDSRARDI